MRALGAVVTLLLWGQLFAVELGNDATDIEDDSCPKPPEIANGYVEHLVRYRCRQFYKLQTEGDGIYTLNSEKQWVNPAAGDKLPKCEAGPTLSKNEMYTAFRSVIDFQRIVECVCVMTITYVLCGKPKHPVDQVQRIIGGSMDAKGSFPWQAKMISRHGLTTGATLISDQWLLTTAQNLFLNHSENATAKDIAPTLTLYVGKNQLVEIEKVVLHPERSVVDIGLIKLKQKVLVTEKVMPICLPSKDYVAPGRMGYVSGWGRNVNFRFTERLKYVMLPVADQEKCELHYEKSTVPEKKGAVSPVGVQPILNKHTFCAGLTKYEEDTCYGDAGSAFAVHDTEEDTWYAAGILSFDKSCAVAEYGVYVRATDLKDWVQETMAKN
uniref:Isoform 2 of Haptoglobin n=1 Tax=Rattus norvegicus TaxID=10116 RepID=P06866-2|nr:Ba1-647 [Rattus norvegicus]